MTRAKDSADDERDTVEVTEIVRINLGAVGAALATGVNLVMTLNALHQGRSPFGYANAVILGAVLTVVMAR